MDHDLATLLAQVIPVAGLALGLEARSATGRIRLRKGKRWLAGRYLFSDASLAVMILAIAAVLAYGEIVALQAVAEGGDAFSQEVANAAGVAIGIAVLLPATEYHRAWCRHVRSPRRRTVALLAGYAVPAALIALALLTNL